MTVPAKIARYADLVMLLSRLLLAWIFLHEGFVLARNINGAIAAMAKLGVPTPYALAGIALQLCAGAMIALGYHTRLGALALSLFCLMTAFCFHTPFGSQNELLHFEKDLAIAGGMLALVVVGAGKFSLENLLARSKKSTRRLDHADMVVLVDGFMLMAIAIATVIGAYVAFGVRIAGLPGL